MPKDTYLSIISEIREVVKQIFSLRRRTRQFREKVKKSQDQAEIGRIRKKLGLQ